MPKGSKASISGQQLEIELNEVTYAIINIDPSKNPVDIDTVHKLSSAINVRLYMEGKQEFPFVPFDNFANLHNEEKIFLYGPSGSGKSRALFELVKKSIGNTRRIYVINPRNNVGDELGRIPLIDLVDKVDVNDVILWDNFPDDLTRRDMVNAKNVLDLLSSKNVGKIIVVLKPKYLEVFRDLRSEIPEFFMREITFNNEQFRKILQQYGAAIPHFKQVYERHVFPRLDKISHILWNKEPTPLTVFDYYNELKNKSEETAGNLDTIKETENMLRSTNYYQHQFGLLTGMEDRKPDAEFLCVLKMCYELGLDRTENNIWRLQHAIFGRPSPKEAFNKLGNWLYISGQQYAMHDVCREAVKLSDYVKMKMLSYISENMEMIDWTSNQAVNLLGLFIGRNIQFVPLGDSSNGFLPSLYAKMKESPTLEKSIGLGIGEEFQTLDDSLQNTILNRCDTDLILGMGLAEGLAQSFLFLDSEQRKLVLQRIYNGFLFARFFGKTLGLLLKDLAPDVRDEILPHIETNSQFADGIGMGVGQVLDLLGEDLKRDIIERARQNIALTRGLGFALASNIGSLDKNERRQVYAKTENDFQYDVGLSFGMAAQYTTLPKEIQDEALARLGDHNGFAKGFGLYLMLYTLDKCPSEVLALVDKNGEHAYSMGFGFGWVYPYLSPKFQSWSKSKSKDNNRFDRGFGFGSGLILRHLDQTNRKNLFSLADKRSEFDYGLGSGIAFTWDYQSSEEKSAAYARCNTNDSFAQGLGYGHGYAFHYLSEDEKSQIFQIADRNSQFDSGLGYGLGWSFPYSDEALQNKMLERTKTNNTFAFGLGDGLGQLYRYHSTKRRMDLFSHAAENGWFARGLGAGLGRYAMEYLDKELQEEILSRVVDNPQFALGLGEGFGRNFKFFSDELKRRILDVHLSQSSFFARGLGIGFGLSFEYLSPESQRQMYKRADENVHFAIGLGEGIGMVFQYLDDLQRKDILSRAIFEANVGFARGFGIGLGRILPFLTEEFRDELLLRSMENSQLEMGLGKGTGSIFTYLPAVFQDKLLKLSEENIHLAIGLGEGIGSVIFGYPIAKARDGLRKTHENSSFARGLGIGIGTFFKYYDSRHELQHEIMENLSTNPSIAEGFGTGIGIAYPYLSEKFLKDLVKLAEKNSHFARSFGFSLGHIPSTLKTEDAIKPLGSGILQNTEMAYGFGAGAGHNFPFLDVATQGEIMNKAMTVKEFGRGFGTGLAKSFRLLDKILEVEILQKAADVDGEFSYNLGYGLGNVFSSLDEDFKRKLLKMVNGKNLFSRGFISGIGRSKEYLDKESLMQISELIGQKSPSSEQGSIDQKPLAEEDEPFASLESHFLYGYFIGTGLSYPLDTSLQSSMFSKEEVTFLGERKKFCVCVIDMISSTKIVSQLDKTQLSKYYSIFLNSMAAIVKNFNGKIIKNTGDGLAYYFPDTTDLEGDPSKLRDALECGVTMIAARNAINSRMQEENLPPVSYRISADYGLLEVVKYQYSQSKDLYGSAMNVCSKINVKALPNGMIIGEDLYNVAHHLREEYAFNPAGKIELGLADRNGYPVYHVEKKRGKDILQPFKYKPL